MNILVILGRLCGTAIDADQDVSALQVQQYPQLEYSKNAVVRAGKALMGKIIWSPDREAEILQIFQVANSWRASHAFPMARLRAELHGRMSAQQVKGLTAARLKRMPSIRAKLQLHPGNLSQIQDLGGCRAVLPSIKEARSLVQSIKDKFPHELLREDAYMDEPRTSGYRSHHLVFGFQPRNSSENAYQGRRIELQIRSRLQHSWATAVEAVGMYIGEDLKGGSGNADWLRLFELMSAELAISEGCECEQQSRVSNIIELNDELNAVQTLETLSHAVSDSDRRLQSPNYRPKYCLIRYDHAKRTVSVKYLDDPAESSTAYGAAERADQKTGLNKVSAVLVEVDKIENLKQAYPNYFGDVQLFKNNLKKIVQGAGAKEYSLPPIERVPPPPKEIPDDSWLRQPKRRRWS